MCIVNMIRKITRIAYKQTPEKGDKGDSGPIHRIRPWASGTEYMPGPGYKYEDYVYYNKRYYSCQKYIASSTTNPYDAVLNSTGEWAYEQNFNFLATGVFFVGDGEGWIFDEGRIYHTSGLIELNADGTIKTNNGAFSVDKYGNLIATSGKFSGFVMANFTALSGNVTLAYSVGNVLAGPSYGNLTLILPTSISFSGRRVLVLDNNFPPYTKTSLMFSTVIKVASGYLYGLGEYADISTPAYSEIAIRGGCIELIAFPNYDGTAVRWMVLAGHECIISKN